ncbi:hypothetical protein KSF73_09845 [Burkholderiaceae bacterium DAT-1]|nr:hypothetical protein [Burkholderiaceae bacterium DAT-1]
MKTGLKPVRLDFKLLIFFENASAEWKGKKRMQCASLLRALIRLYRKYPEREGFQGVEIVEEMELEAATGCLGSPAKPADPDRIRKFARELFKDLQKCFDEKLSGIQQRLSEKGFAESIRLFKFESTGGPGNPSLYGIEFESIPEINISTRSDCLPDPSKFPYVTYREDDVIAKGRLINVFRLGMRLEGVGKWMTVLWLVFLLGVSVLFGVLILIQVFYLKHKLDDVSILFNAALILFFVHHFKFVVSLPAVRVALAPGWLQNEERDLIVSWGKNPGQPAVLKLIRYGANCPICGGEIRLRAGRIRFMGRIIGACENSPREHVYSFDHVMRRGKLLVDY